MQYTSRAADRGRSKGVSRGTDQDRMARFGARRPRRRLRQDPPPRVRRSRRAGSARPAGRVRAAPRERSAAGLGEERDRRVPVPRRRRLHRRRRRVQLRQRDHRRTARERVADPADQLVRHRATPGRVLLPARQRRLRRRCRARRRLAEAPRPRARRGVERDLAERRGVLPVLPPGVPAPRRQHRRGRDREPEPRRTSRRISTTCARSSADALVYMGYGMLAAKGLLREALDKLGVGPAAHHGHRRSCSI